MQISVQAIIYLIVGILFLTFGKRLFWLFVGCAGFIIGFEYGGTMTGIRDPWIILFVAVFTGAVGAVFACFVQGIAIGMAGFLVGGFSAINLLELLGLVNYQHFWSVYIVGGIIGLILMFLIFDYAIIFLSSIAGAFVVVQALSLIPPVKTIVFLILAMAGAVFQASALQRK